MALTNLMYKGIHFDSDEEVFVAMWCNVLQDHGYIAKWKRTTDPIKITKGYKIPYTKTTQLKTKIKKEDKQFTILRPSEYTPDFHIIWTRKGLQKFLYNCLADRLPEYRREKEEMLTDPSKALFFSAVFNDTIIEIKPAFDMQNMERGFIHKQKYLFDKYQIFVNLVEPVELFKKTFLPLLAEPFFRYKVVPKKAKAKGKKVGDYKFDWIPKTIDEFLNTK